MSISFTLNLREPLTKITQYLFVLKNVELKKLSPYLINTHPTQNPRHPLKSGDHRSEFQSILAHRTVSYCAFVHPLSFAKFGAIDSWYEWEHIAGLLKNGVPIYEPSGFGTLSQEIENQKPFIMRIQKTNKRSPKPLSERSLIRYEKFMTSIKRNGDSTSIIPPHDVDLVWQAHMLDHKAYAEATKSYFGRIIKYDDRLRNKYDLIQSRNRTAAVSEKHFPEGKNSKPLNDNNPDFVDDTLMHLLTLEMLSKTVSNKPAVDPLTHANEPAEDTESNDSYTEQDS